MFYTLSDSTKYTFFETSKGAEELYGIIRSGNDVKFIELLRHIESEYDDLLNKCNFNADNIYFVRFYVSDIANQKDELVNSTFFKSLQEVCSVSIIEQPPLGKTNLGLLVKGIKSETITSSVVKSNDNWSSICKLTGRHYSQFWSANLIGEPDFDSYAQTNKIFDDYTAFLKENEMTLFDDCHRTWIYVRDIDNHYQGMVDSRREFFEKHNMTADTHYIASTGIEARVKEVRNLVSMDALSFKGLEPSQVEYMEALEHLNPTHEYGVTFERGTKIAFGDREHFHISGTASIDNKGDVVHVGDIKNQTYRTLENISALLKPHGARLDNMSFLIVYLRDISHYHMVNTILREELGDSIPLLIVRGAVCRPTWLIEMEGIGIKSADNPYPPLA